MEDRIDRIIKENIEEFLISEGLFNKGTNPLTILSNNKGNLYKLLESLNNDISSNNMGFSPNYLKLRAKKIQKILKDEQAANNTATTNTAYTTNATSTNTQQNATYANTNTQGILQVEARQKAQPQAQQQAQPQAQQQTQQQAQPQMQMQLSQNGQQSMMKIQNNDALLNSYIQDVSRCRNFGKQLIQKEITLLGKYLKLYGVKEGKLYEDASGTLANPMDLFRNGFRNAISGFKKGYKWGYGLLDKYNTNKKKRANKKTLAQQIIKNGERFNLYLGTIQKNSQGIKQVEKYCNAGIYLKEDIEIIVKGQPFFNEISQTIKNIEKIK